jgi:hypothetical protein
MNKGIFWAVGLLALVINFFGLYDLYLILSRDPEYLAQAPAGFIAMIEGFPQWRQLLWTVSAFTGVIGAVLFLLRRAMAERVFWATAFFMALGFFGYDLLVADGLTAYGTIGLIFSLVIIGLQCAFALYARRATRQGLLR